MEFMKILLATITYFCALSLQAQDPNGLLTVTGEATMKVKPDEVIANFRMVSKSMDYDKTIQILGDKTDRLAKVLRAVGYSSGDLKTAQMMVSKNYSFTKGIRKDSGYVATQMLELSFALDSEAMIKLVTTISESSVDPQLSFNFQVSENRLTQVKENLIALAVKDARKKAEIIAESSMLEIHGIREIRYGKISRPEPSMYRMMESASAEMPEYGGFNIRDLTFSESIEITYLIRSGK
jgi:uncharacterized protein YggE